MKLNREYLLHNTGSESVLVPTGNANFSGVVRGNKTFGTVLELLKNETTEEAMISALKTRFHAPEGAVETDVARALVELCRIGALNE